MGPAELIKKKHVNFGANTDGAVNPLTNDGGMGRNMIPVKVSI
jgi:hypothetical protein